MLEVFASYIVLSGTVYEDENNTIDYEQLKSSMYKNLGEIETELSKSSDIISLTSLNKYCTKAYNEINEHGCFFSFKRNSLSTILEVTTVSGTKIAMFEIRNLSGWSQDDENAFNDICRENFLQLVGITSNCITEWEKKKKSEGDKAVKMLVATLIICVVVVSVNAVLRYFLH